MKNFLFLFLCVAALAIPVHAAPDLAVGDRFRRTVGADALLLLRGNLELGALAHHPGRTGDGGAGLLRGMVLRTAPGCGEENV